MHEFFDHTADLGLRARADDLPGVFAAMARCLTAAMLEDPAGVQETTTVRVEIPGTDAVDLMYDWLRELLYCAEVGGMLFADFAVVLGPTGLSAECRGEPVDPTRHVPAREVKAVTYHDLRVEREGAGWIAEVIVDI